MFIFSTTIIVRSVLRISAIKSEKNLRKNINKVLAEKTCYRPLKALQNMLVTGPG